MVFYRLVLSLLLLTNYAFADGPKMALEQDLPKRYGIRINDEIFPQSNPKETLTSVLKAIQKDRLDYLTAILIEPKYIDDQFAISYPTFEQKTKVMVDRENLESKGYDVGFVRTRIKTLATYANFHYLVTRVNKKLALDPDSISDLRLILNEGDFQEAGDECVARHKSLLDRAAYFKRVGTRWHLMNKMQDEAKQP